MELQKVLRQDGTIWFLMANVGSPLDDEFYLMEIAPEQASDPDEWVEIMAYKIRASDGEMVWREKH